MSDSTLRVKGEKDHHFTLSERGLSIDGQEVESYLRDEDTYQSILTGLHLPEVEANLLSRLMMNAPYIDYGDGMTG